MSADKEVRDEIVETPDLPQEDEVTRESPTPDYEVGYGKPPRTTRFQPGQSGNPRGRLKGLKNLKTDLLEELGETILVREGDQSRRVSKQRGVVMTMVARTLKGDARAATILTSWMMRLLDTGANSTSDDEPLAADEVDILSHYEARILRDANDPTVTPPDSPDESEES